MAQCHCSGI